MTAQQVTERLWQAIDRRADEMTGIVAELVKRPSLLGHEADAQAYVAEVLSGAGYATESWDLGDSVVNLPNAGRSGVPFAGRPNVSAKRSGTGGGRSLILNGHIDVVSPEPVSAWSHDPWAASIVDGKMYGRGAYDMKSGVGINLFLARLMQDMNIPLAGDLTLHSVIEEECTGNGALAASLRDRADACLITEPDGDSIARAHVGVMWFTIKVEGVSAHAGWAWQGTNAIVKMQPIIAAMVRLNEELNEQIHPIWAGMHHPINLNVGVIEGGDWPSTVPGACTIHCRTSFFPGISVEQMRARIAGAVAEAATGDDWLKDHRPVVSYSGFSTAGCIVEEDAPIIQVMQAAHKTVTGHDAILRNMTAVTDQRYYIFAGTPSVCYGAKGGNAHAADEWLDVASLVPAAKAVAKFVVDWCGVSE